MIRENDLLDAIAECQGERNPDARTCRNLASYYTILDHIKEDNDTKNKGYSYDSFVMYDSGSEFSDKIYGRDMSEILAVMDELMETLNVINPRLYNAVMRKL